MITISILGLDQYVVGHYSKEHSENLANLMEISEDDLNFYAPYSVIFHKGVEQTSWHTEVIVRAPERLMVMEERIADYLLRTLNEVSINVELSFQYFDENRHYEIHNDAYPRYIESENVMEVEADNDSDLDEEEPNPADHPELDINNPDEIYLGNVFAGHEEELEHIGEEKEHECHHDHCCCGHKHN